MTKVHKQKSSVGARMWIILILVGLIGQFAWAVENMYLNSFIFYLYEGAPENSTMIAITTAASAITAALTTIFMGVLTDKVGRKKIFIVIGYILWGLATASFGLINTSNGTTLLPIAMSATTAAIMVIIIDVIMTFFGSTANDAAFNSYVTKNIKNEHRGKVEGVLSILPLIAMLVIFVGLNPLTTKENGSRWDLFFYIIGAIVMIVGIISIFLIPKETVEKSNEKYIRIMAEGFKPSTVKNNKILYLTLLVYLIFTIGINVFFPYLMVYIEHACNIPNSGESFLTPFAIVMAVALLGGSVLTVFYGRLIDKKGKFVGIIPISIILILGLIAMFFVKYIEDTTLRIVYGCGAGLIMIFGYIGSNTVLNSIVREYTPEGKEGTFMGVRMLFVVMIPMMIGPFIGDALNQNLGTIYVNPSDPTITTQVPTEYGYLVAIGIIILMVIPLIFLLKEVKKEKEMAKELNISNEEISALDNDLTTPEKIIEEKKINSAVTSKKELKKQLKEKE